MKYLKFVDNRGDPIINDDITIRINPQEFILFTSKGREINKEVLRTHFCFKARRDLLKIYL